MVVILSTMSLAMALRKRGTRREATSPKTKLRERLAYSGSSLCKSRKLAAPPSSPEPIMATSMRIMLYLVIPAFLPFHMHFTRRGLVRTCPVEVTFPRARRTYSHRHFLSADEGICESQEDGGSLTDGIC